MTPTPRQQRQHSSDEMAQKTFLGPDDKRFLAEKKRKRAPKAELPAIPDGPCCARCANWEAPNDDGFGQCREVVIVDDGHADTRRAMTRAEARELFLFGGDPLRTRGFFEGCRLFAAQEERETA